MDTLIGSLIGGYTIKRFLGSGGMGAVYLAEDPVIGQQVAIKVVRTDGGDLPDTEKAFERFKQEARAVASLDHLHILPLYRYGEEQTSAGRRAYMVMQYRPEGSLWDWLRRRAGMASDQSLAGAAYFPAALPTSWPLSLSEAEDYLQQAAAALQYAHEHGIVHRDIKPANFLLRIDQGPRIHLLLSDFGLAKFFSSSSATSHIFGTPLYMAPEQFDGEARPESDQYALAVMIYLMLAGRAPFEGDPMQLMHQHLSKEVPPIRTFNPTLPAAIEAVFARALAKAPEQRYPSVMAFAEAFADVGRNQTTLLQPRLSLPTLEASTRNELVSDPAAAPRPAPVNIDHLRLPRNASPLPPTVVAGARGGTGSAGGNTPLPQAFSQEAASAPTVFAPPSMPGFGQQSLLQPGQVPPVPPPAALPGPGPLPPAGPPSRQQGMSRRSALLWLSAGIVATGVLGGTGLYLYLRNRRPALALAVLRGHQDAVTSLAWSPDGSQLVSGSRDQTARLWSLTSSDALLTYSQQQTPILAVAWSNDGTLLASGGENHSVQVWTPGGALQETFADLGAPVSALVWTARRSVLLAGTVGNGGHELVLSGQVSGNLLKTRIRALALSPAGDRLAAGLDSGSVVVTNLVGKRTVQTYYRHSGAALALAWSPDGTQLASGGADRVAVVLDGLSGVVQRRLAHPGAVNGVSWEPSGSGRLATACSDHNVRVWNTSLGTHLTYGGHEGSVTSVAWGPHGLASASADTSIILWRVL